MIGVGGVVKCYFSCRVWFWRFDWGGDEVCGVWWSGSVNVGGYY